MAPKLDPTEVKYVFIRQVGGEIGASSALAPKLGPMGMSPKKVGEDIAKATAAYKGMKVSVKLTVQNRVATIDIVPTASSLLIKALKEPLRDRKKVKNIKHSGNLTFEDIFTVARALRYKSLAKEFSGTVKEVLGTCSSIGCTVEDKNPSTVLEMIRAGELDVPSA